MTHGGRVFFPFLAILLVSLSTTVALVQVAGAQSNSSTLSMKVNVVPNEIPADGGTYSAIFVQLSSRGGQVAAAPQDYLVSLTSANVTVATVPPTLLIQKGQNYGVATVTTTTKPGSTDITLAATGLMPSLVTVKTYAAGGAPYKLASFAAPPTLISDGISSYYFVIQLQDASGTPTQAPSSLSVSVTSSNPGVAQLPPTLAIPQGGKGASEKFTAGLVAGSTTITVQLNNILSSSINVTSGFLPLSVALNTPSASGVTTGSSAQFTVNALTSGLPLSGASVNWTASSSADAFTSKAFSTDQNGTASATLKLNAAGNTTVTATVNAPGYGAKSASVTFPVTSRPLTVTVIPDSTQVNASQSTAVTALVTSAGKPVQGAQVTWSSSIGAVAPPASTTGASGAASTIFISQANGNATITASASASGYVTGTGIANITVGSSPSSSSSGSSVIWAPLAYLPGPVFFGIPILLVVLVVLIVVIVLFLRRRRGRQAAPKEAPPEEGQTEAEGE